MDLRGFLGRQCHPHTILCLPLPTSLRSTRRYRYSPALPTRDRVQQPHGCQLRSRQSLLPPLLLIQRPSRLRSPNPSSGSPSTIFTQSSGRPRQLHPRKPPGNPATHQTRMILPLRLRHSSIHPQQTRRSSGAPILNPRAYGYPVLTHLKTAEPHVPTPYASPLLGPYRRRADPHMNRRHAGRGPLHHHWTTSVGHLLLYLLVTSPHCQLNGKRNNPS